MKIKRAPKLQNGLAIPPRKRDCVGETCPVADKIGSCFVDTHHIYFPRKDYLEQGEIYAQLFHDPHSKISIARCRHNSSDIRAQHTLYNKVDFPRKNVVLRYLEESRFLQDLGVKVDSLSTKLDIIEAEIIKPTEEVIDELGLLNQQLQERIITVKNIEVMPEQISVASINKYMNRFGPRIPVLNEILAA